MQEKKDQNLSFDLRVLNEVMLDNLLFVDKSWKSIS